MSKGFAKKRYGQNFLVDKNKIEEIISSIDFNLPVIEVGPGRGALTREITKHSNDVIAIEIDESFKKELEKISNVKIIYSDVLKLDFNNFINEEKIFISNLPYYISTKILFKVLENPKFKFINIMIQKELANRINAIPRTKEYGRLTVSINTFLKVNKIIKVSRTCFRPEPNVDSQFIFFERKDEDLKNMEEYLKFIKSSFANKRKTWLNSLKLSNFVNFNVCEKWLNEKGYPITYRAEQITIKEFQEIFLRFSF